MSEDQSHKLHSIYMYNYGYLHNFNISITSVCRVEEVICCITQPWLQNFISFTASYLQKKFNICHHLFDNILFKFHVNFMYND